MRLGERFMCPACGDIDAHAGRCIACGAPRLDAQGRLDVTDDGRAWSFVGIMGSLFALPVGAALLPSGIGVAAVACMGLMGSAWSLWSIGRVATKVRSLRRARAVRAIVEATPLTTIDAASDGVAHVRGVVRVQREVEASDGSRCAAWCGRETVLVACECPEPGCELFVERTTTVQQCGRFAVVDATGAAVIDDDCFALARGEDADDGPLVVRAGDTVSVVGPARRTEPVGVDEVASTSYREQGVTPASLIFDGKPTKPLVIVV